MLVRAGAADVARAVDFQGVDAILPRVAETAFRLRFAEHDEAKIHAAALRQAGGAR
jgi:hypothetical protein